MTERKKKASDLKAPHIESYLETLLHEADQTAESGTWPSDDEVRQYLDGAADKVLCERVHVAMARDRNYRKKVLSAAGVLPPGALEAIESKSVEVMDRQANRQRRTEDGIP